MPPLVVLSHLRWDFVFQRPQHLMTRFAQTTTVWFVEEPVYDPGEPHFEVSQPLPNLRVLKPHTPIEAKGFSDVQLAVLTPMLKAAVADLAKGAYCAWLYTPMALPLLDALTPQLVIYDCMDELSAFSQAPIQLQLRERALIKHADLVFTGGPSLYKAKRSQHPSTHCFPSAVDAKHFARGADPANAASILAPLPHPRFGFFGVVDERFDVELLAALAAARPQWQICIVGPVVKIDESVLPRRPNIHYFGQQPYSELPSFIAGWDVCLLLFALNEATRFISPTKTLEYMAAEHPVVSTPVTDVVDLYGDLVTIASSADEFIAAAERLLNESTDQRILRIAAMRRRVESLSWDGTARKMELLIAEAVAAKSDSAAASGKAGRGAVFGKLADEAG
ncbi:MAG: UDP-galactopyranose mutase [Betaproteobacteria bacterium]|nr:UDP-galactopyranose mutase [Betaproteobacteria bacterium]